MKKSKMNLEMVRSNLEEAAEELVNLVGKAANGSLHEGEFQVGLLHAYHHLNWSWNSRHEPKLSHANLTKEKFDAWGKYPTEIEDL